MGRYAITIDSISNESASTSTIACMKSASTVRPKIYDLIVGSRASPNDYSCTYNLARYDTSHGTSTAFTPIKVDPADPASVTGAGYDHSVNASTYSNPILKFSTNLRATFRWVAAPGGELIAAATDNNGIGMYTANSTTAYNVEVTIFFEE